MLNMDWSKKCLKQELWRKNLHFVPNTLFYKSYDFQGNQTQQDCSALCAFPELFCCEFTQAYWNLQVL